MKRKKSCDVCAAFEGPAIFANEKWCSDNCRKLFLGEITESLYSILTGKTKDPATGLMSLKLSNVVSHKSPTSLSSRAARLHGFTND